MFFCYKNIYLFLDLFLFSCDWDKAIIECCMTIILCEVLPEPGHTTIIAIISHHKYIHRCRKNIFICRSTALVSDRDSVSANTHVSELVSGISSHVRWLTVVCWSVLKTFQLNHIINHTQGGWEGGGAAGYSLLWGSASIQTCRRHLTRSRGTTAVCVRPQLRMPPKPHRA